jgi:hypothetical protein
VVILSGNVGLLLPRLARAACSAVRRYARAAGFPVSSIIPR